MDQETKWSSTYCMMVRWLIEFCENYCHLFKGLIFADSKLDEIRQSTNALQPLAELSTKLQGTTRFDRTCWILETFNV